MILDNITYMKYFIKKYDETAFEMSNKKALDENGKLINNDLRPVLRDICLYLNGCNSIENKYINEHVFSSDTSDSKKYKWNLKKGLLMIGLPGCGKTTILKTIKKMKYAGLTDIIGRSSDCRTLAKKYSDEGRWGFNSAVGLIDKDIILDEIGDEPEFVNADFKIKEAVMYDFLKEKLDAWSEYNPKPRIFGATNLSLKHLAIKYDEKLADRLLERCNVIYMPKVNFRGAEFENK